MGTCGIISFEEQTLIQSRVTPDASHQYHTFSPTILHPVGNSYGGGGWNNNRSQTHWNKSSLTLLALPPVEPETTTPTSVWLGLYSNIGMVGFIFLLPLTDQHLNPTGSSPFRTISSGSAHLSGTLHRACFDPFLNANSNNFLINPILHHIMPTFSLHNRLPFLSLPNQNWQHFEDQPTLLP